MLKHVIKELIIVLLLILAILLILGVFLYDYIPTNKIVPKAEQYQVPNSIKEELEENVDDINELQTEMVYEINGSDLQNYEKTNDYQKGKVNPFSLNTTENTNNSQNTSTSDNNNSNGDNTNETTNNDNNNNNNNNNNTNDNTNNSEPEGSYLPKTGTK